MKTDKEIFRPDEIDLAILEQLQRDCRQTVAQISERVHLSTSSCHRRIKTLEQAGIIKNYVAKLSSKRLGYSVEFFVELSLATQVEDAFEEFESAVRKIPEVLECYLVGGQYDSSSYCCGRRGGLRTDSSAIHQSLAWRHEDSIHSFIANGESRQRPPTYLVQIHFCSKHRIRYPAPTLPTPENASALARHQHLLDVLAATWARDPCRSKEHEYLHRNRALPCKLGSTDTPSVGTP